MVESLPLSRIFVAITFPDQVVTEISRIQEQLSKKNFTGKLTELNNLHLTLKFIGEVDEPTLNLVREKLKSIKFKALEMKLGETGTFARHGALRTVWVKLEGRTLWDLQKNVDAIMAELGFAKEEKFMAHITIARIKYVEDKNSFREYVKSIKTSKIEFTVNEIALKKSDLQQLGPIYTNLQIYPLQ